MPKDKVKPHGIAGWPKSERPRERLLAHGADKLSDAELVAIMLRIGMPGGNAVDAGRSMIEHFGSLESMVAAPLSAMMKIKGIKEAKAAQLKAAMEIASRVASRQAMNSEDGRLRITSTAQAKDYILARLSNLPEEHFRVLFLNSRSVLLEDQLIANGDVASVSVSLRRIMILALQVNASAVIAAHNHPSGNAQPSESDRLLTKDLIAAARPLGVRVLDHLIVANGKVYSLADEGMLDELEVECLAPGVTLSTSRLS